MTAAARRHRLNHNGELVLPVRGHVVPPGAKSQSNLKVIGLALRMWADDNEGQLPLCRCDFPTLNPSMQALSHPCHRTVASQYQVEIVERSRVRSSGACILLGASFIMTPWCNRPQSFVANIADTGSINLNTGVLAATVEVPGDA